MKVIYRLNSELYTATSLKDVPARIDHLITFDFDFPPHPHTKEQHAEMAQMSSMLMELLDREKR